MGIIFICSGWSLVYLLAIAKVIKDYWKSKQ